MPKLHTNDGVGDNSLLEMAESWMHLFHQIILD